MQRTSGSLGMYHEGQALRRQDDPVLPQPLCPTDRNTQDKAVTAKSVHGRFLDL